jgi:hypothetical protein
MTSHVLRKASPHNHRFLHFCQSMKSNRFIKAQKKGGKTNKANQTDNQKSDRQPRIIKDCSLKMKKIKKNGQNRFPNQLRQSHMHTIAVVSDVPKNA